MKTLSAELLAVPRTPALLGYAGLIPFVLLSAALWLAPGEYKSTLHTALLAYASIILSFMGAVHWGMAMWKSAENESAQFIWSVVPR